LREIKANSIINTWRAEPAEEIRRSIVVQHTSQIKKLLRRSERCQFN